MHLAQKFFKKSIHIADYIAFILPISQLNNSRSMYQFDLVYSEDLGKQRYTDRDLHCCFNVYRRPSGNKLNTRPVSKLKDVSIIRQDSKKYETTTDYDLRMCYWGNGSAGKILSDDENYSAEYKIVVHNKELRDAVSEVLHKVDWNSRLNKIAMLKIQQFHIIDLLKSEIENIN